MVIARQPFVENGYLSLRFPNKVKVNIHEHWTRVTRFNALMSFCLHPNKPLISLVLITFTTYCSWIEVFLSHHPYCFSSQSQTSFGLGAGRVTLGSLSKGVFEWCWSTGSKAFSLLIDLPVAKFVILSANVPIETTCPENWQEPLPNTAKSPLPVDLGLWLKTSWSRFLSLRHTKRLRAVGNYIICRRESTPVSTVLRKSVIFFIKKYTLNKKNFPSWNLANILSEWLRNPGKGTSGR